jgi:hypothetical protein
MNLNAIVGPALGVVTPQVTFTIQVSNGYSTDASGARTPLYKPTFIIGSLQPVSAGTLRLLEGLGIQGQARRIYANGRYNGAVRSAQKGGDLFTFPDGTVWKITEVSEYWPDWCSFVVVLQNGS